MIKERKCYYGAMILAGGILLFALTNTGMITFNFIGMHVRLPLVAVILPTALSGALTSYLLNLRRRVQQIRRFKEMARVNQKMINENKELKESVLKLELEIEDLNLKIDGCICEEEYNEND